MGEERKERKERKEQRGATDVRLRVEGSEQRRPAQPQHRFVRVESLGRLLQTDQRLTPGRAELLVEIQRPH